MRNDPKQPHPQGRTLSGDLGRSIKPGQHSAPTHLVTGYDSPAPVRAELDPELSDPVRNPFLTQEHLEAVRTLPSGQRWPERSALNGSEITRSWEGVTSTLLDQRARSGSWDSLPYEDRYLADLVEMKDQLLPQNFAWLIHIPVELTQEIRPLIVLAESPAPGDRLILRRPWEDFPSLTVTLMWPAQRVKLSKFFLGAAQEDALWLAMDEEE